MTRTDTLFLAVLRRAVRGEDYDGPLTEEDAKPLFSLAQEHAVLPLVLEALCRRREIRGSEAFRPARTHAVSAAIRQITQDNEFLTMLLKLQGHGLDPIVVKGLACRALYPKPFLRPSVDEDILVPSEDLPEYARLLVQYGMFADDPEADLTEVFEAGFHKEGSPLYIEVHRHLFEPDSDAFGDLGRPLADAPFRAVTIQAQDLTVRTLHPSDHVMYLILHALKHFLHSGFGIRYVCDICLFAERYGEEIDWERVMRECTALRADRFAAAIFRIGEKHLGIPSPAFCRDTDVDEAPLLEDILPGGLYGVSDENRLHSVRSMLNAKASGDGDGWLINALFPGADYLRQRYPYAKDHPILLPLAWTQRLFAYCKRARNKEDGVSISESVRIGRERVRLMELYRII